MSKRKDTSWFGWLIAGGSVAVLTALAIADRKTVVRGLYGLRGLRGVGLIPPPTSSYDDAPTVLKTLPFNALRSELPIDSPARMQALEQTLSGEPDVIARMPQSTMFTRWHQSAGTFGASLEGLVAAVTQEQPRLREMRRGLDRVPRLTFHDAAEPMNALPTTSTPYEVPIARGLSQEQTLTAFQLAKYGDIAAQVDDSSTAISASVAETPIGFASHYETLWDGDQLRYVPREG